jgi:hypothetical protein
MGPLGDLPTATSRAASSAGPVDPDEPPEAAEPRGPLEPAEPSAQVEPARPPAPRESIEWHGVDDPSRPTTPPEVGLTILNPTPQEEIDRMWPHGRARGVVTAAHQERRSAERALRTKVLVSVRGRLPGGGWTADTTVTAWVHWRVAAMLQPGLEVPVEVDPSSGRVTGLSTRQLTEEIARRAAEDSTPKPARAMPPRDEHEEGEITADDPLLVPVEGVTLEMVAQIHAAIAAGPLPPGGIDEVATAAGVPEARWESVDQVWRRRIVTSPALARRFRVARDEARREPC